MLAVIAEMILDLLMHSHSVFPQKCLLEEGSVASLTSVFLYLVMHCLGVPPQASLPVCLIRTLVTFYALSYLMDRSPVLS